MHIRLREIRQDDLKLLYEFQCDEESNRLAAVYSRSQIDFASHWEYVLKSRQIHVRAICVDGVLAGSISCFRHVEQSWIGYWLGRHFWGRGVATEALSQFLKSEDRRPLYARVATGNPASIRVLEKNGFSITGYEASPATHRFVECEEAMLELM